MEATGTEVTIRPRRHFSGECFAAFGAFNVRVYSFATLGTEGRPSLAHPPPPRLEGPMSDGGPGSANVSQGADVSEPVLCANGCGFYGCVLAPGPSDRGRCRIVRTCALLNLSPNPSSPVGLRAPQKSVDIQLVFKVLQGRAREQSRRCHQTRLRGAPCECARSLGDSGGHSPSRPRDPSRAPGAVQVNRAKLWFAPPSPTWQPRPPRAPRTSRLCRPTPGAAGPATRKSASRGSSAAVATITARGIGTRINTNAPSTTRRWDASRWPRPTRWCRPPK